MKNLKSIALTAILSGATFLSFSQEKEIKTPEQRAEKRTEAAFLPAGGRCSRCQWLNH